MQIKAFIKVLLLALIAMWGTTARGQWSDHFSYNNSIYVARTKTKAIAGCELGLFAYDTSEKTLEKITKTNLLSGSDISAVSDDGNSTIYVGYSSGDIDIIDMENYRTVNIPELKLSTNYDQKSINGFFKSGSKLYCASSCGVIEVGLSQYEIRSHYKITSDALEVNALTVLNDTIYAATATGLWKANAKSQILESMDEWTNVETSETAFSDIVVFDGKVYTAAGTKGSDNNIYRVDGDSLTEVMTVSNFRNFDVEDKTLLVAATNNISLYDTQLNLTFTMNNFVEESDEDGEVTTSLGLRQARFFDDERFVVANYGKGLVLVDKEKKGQTYLPNGPANNYTFDLLSLDNITYCTAGGCASFSSNYFRSLALHCYKDYTWCTATDTGTDAFFLAYDKNSPDSVYFSSFNTGFYKVEGTEITKHYYADNSPLIDIFGGDKYTWVKSIAYDNYSNLIITNNNVTPDMYVISRDGEWHALSYDVLDNIHSTSHMIVTANDHIWLIIPRNDYVGLFILDMNGTPYDDSDDLYRVKNYTGNDSRYFGTSAIVDEDGEQITTSSNVVYDLEEDRNGQIWLATDNGVAVYNNDKTIFESTTAPVFARIKVPRNDGTNNADYLLDGNVVTAIAIDGANRKWLGTQSNGAYLVSSDGLETLLSFNTDNSPLPTNEISSISVSPSSGEVFFATPQGLVSYMGDAVEPIEKLDKIKVYPNPVTASFTSNIKITGLEENTQVKITDILGRLVCRTTSNGGMATWNGKNLEGKRVATGNYLVWAINADGTESAVGKIVVIK